MITLSSLPNIVVHRDVRISPLASRPTFTPLEAGAPLTFVQRIELGKVLAYLDNLEDTIKAPGRNTSKTLIESVNGSVFAQSRVLVSNADNAISQTQSANRVINGGFEENIISSSFEYVDNVTGWSNSSDSVIEIWRSVNGMPSIQGDQHVELDARRGENDDTLNQIISTVPGQVYDFSFASAPRLAKNASTNAFEVYFDGELLDTIRESGVDDSELDWNVYRFTVEATSTESEISFRELLSDGSGPLLDAVSLTESSKAVGTSSVSDISTTTNPVVLSEASLESGTIVINNKSIFIDVDNHSLQDIVDSINTAATVVNAALIYEGVNAENQDLFTIELTSDNAGYVLSDNGTGLLAAIGLQEGAYGLVYENSSKPSSKIRGYRAANALEKIQESFKTLFRDKSSNGSASLKSFFSTMFSNLTEQYGTSKLSALGLDFNDLENGILDIDRQSRKRFAKAVYENDKVLNRMLLSSYANGEKGLIDVIREGIKSELTKQGASIGSIINTYA